MNRDWAPFEHYLNEQQQIKEGYGDIFNFMENLKIKYANGKEENVYSPEEMAIRRQFPMIGKLLGYGFLGLYERLSSIPGGVDLLHEKDRELAQIVETKEADEDSYLYKWFVGKLDEHFCYSEHNNELFCANVLAEAQLLTGKVWITVYKDTLGVVDDEDNLTEILVPSDWLIKQLKTEGIENFSEWFYEYTADDTDDIARRALDEGVILECDVLSYLRYKQDWYKSHGISEEDIANLKKEYEADASSGRFFGSFDSYELEFGYHGGEAYVCFEEFLNNEAQIPATGVNDVEGIIADATFRSKETNLDVGKSVDDRGFE